MYVVWGCNDDEEDKDDTRCKRDSMTKKKSGNSNDECIERWFILSTYQSWYYTQPPQPLPAIMCLVAMGVWAFGEVISVLR